MVDLELLARRSRRVAEISRLRFAARMAPAALLFAIAGVAIAGGPTPRIAAATALLMGLIVFFRWRSRAASNGANAGLIAAAIPIGAVFIVRAICGPDANGECGVYCSTIGFAAGALVTLVHARSLRPTSACFAAAMTAISAIAVGCLALGIGIAAAVAIVSLAGVLAGWSASRVLVSA